MQPRGFLLLVSIVLCVAVPIRSDRRRTIRERGHVVPDVRTTASDKRRSQGSVTLDRRHRSADFAGQLLVKKEFTTSQVAHHGARCLDGSPSGYYVRSGLLNSSWVVFLQGGGYCNTMEDCSSLSLGRVGSSRQWPETKRGQSLVSLDPAVNRDFRLWNHVYVPSCSGDLHSGQTRTPNEWGLYFAGHLTLVAVLSDLLNTTNLRRASHVVVSGSSAGGVGTFEHADFIRDMLPWADVKAVPIGGLYVPSGVREFVYWKQNKSQPDRNSSLYDLFQSFVHVECKENNTENPHFCGPANVGFLLPYITTPLFVAENQYDKDKLKRLGCPVSRGLDQTRYVQFYGEQLRQTLLDVTRSRRGNGIFSPSCLDHTATLDKVYQSPEIEGFSFGKSLYRWYFRGKRASRTKLTEKCGNADLDSLPCNHAAKCRSPRN